MDRNIEDMNKYIVEMKAYLTKRGKNLFKIFIFYLIILLSENNVWTSNIFKWSKDTNQMWREVTIVGQFHFK